MSKTNYEKYCDLAELNRNIKMEDLEVGDYVFCEQVTDKLNGFEDYVRWTLDKSGRYPQKRLCRIADFVVCDEDWDFLNNWMHWLSPENNGGEYSDDVDESKDPTQYTSEDYATFFSLVTIYIKPSGKYIAVNSSGYKYWRYVYMPENYKEMYKGEFDTAVESIKNEEQARKIEKEQELQKHRDEYDAQLSNVVEFGDTHGLTRNPGNVVKTMQSNVRKWLTSCLTDDYDKNLMKLNFSGNKAFLTLYKDDYGKYLTTRNRLFDNALCTIQAAYPRGEMGIDPEYGYEYEVSCSPWQEVYGHVNIVTSYKNFDDE